MNDSQSTNLGGKSNIINSFNQPPALGSDHSSDDNSIYVCRDESPSTSYHLLVSHEDITFDPKYDLLENGIWQGVSNEAWLKFVDNKLDIFLS